MRNERGFTFVQLIIVLIILALVVGTCVYAFKNAPPPGPTLSGISITATPTTLAAGGTTAVLITVTLSGPAPVPGQTIFVRVLEADYFGDDELYKMHPVLVPPGSTSGMTAVVLECSAADRSLRAPPGSGQNDYSDHEAQWDLRVIPYYGLYPQSNDVPISCPGEGE